MFKEKALQDLAETSNNIFKSLRGKGKITESSLSFLLLFIRRLQTWERCMYYLKFIKDFLMFQADQLYRTVARLQEKFRSLWIVI